MDILILKHYLFLLASKISLYAGVLALGVGDSLAAIVGTKWGAHTWPGKVNINAHMYTG